MGKKGNDKSGKKKLSKKDKKAQNHLKLMKGGKTPDSQSEGDHIKQDHGQDKKKSA